MSRIVPVLGDTRRRKTLMASGLLILLILLPLGLDAVIRGASVLFSAPPEAIGGIDRPPNSVTPATWPPLLLSSLIILGLALVLAYRMRSRAIDGSPRVLALLGLLSLTTYTLHFLYPFPLQSYYSLRRVSMGWIADRDPLAALSTAIAMVNLFLLFYLSYRLCRRQRSPTLWLLLILGMSLFALANLFTFNLTSTDIYDYVSRGRITAVYDENPYFSIPGDFPDDPLVQLAAWRNSPSAYGPLWEQLSGAISKLFGDWLWGSVIAYKFVATLGYLGGVLFIALLLRRTMPERALSGTLFFAWNPLILLEGLANAHNDMLMIALLLAGMWALYLSTHKNGESTRLLDAAFSFTLLGMAVLIKFVPILLLPIFLLTTLKGVSSWRRRIIHSALALLPSVFLFALSYRSFWRWPEILGTFAGRLELFRMSLASAALEILQIWIDRQVGQLFVTLLFISAFVVSYIIVTMRTAYRLGVISPANSLRLRSRTLQRIFGPGTTSPAWMVIIRSSVIILALYILLGSLWFWPWYLIWPIGLFSIQSEDDWVLPVLLVSTAGQISHVLWNFLWYWMGISWENLYQVDILVVASLLLPALGVFLWRRRALPFPAS